MQLKGSRTKDVKALCFDVFGTVTDWRSSVINEGALISEKLNIEVPWGEFVDKWRIDGYMATLMKIASGDISVIPTEEIHKCKLLSLLDEYNISTLSDKEVNHFNLAWNRIKVWDDSIRGIQRLREYFRVMPFSNGDFSCLLEISKNNKLDWDGIISADFFKKVKPDLSIYGDAANLLHLDPSEIMMVAAHDKDLAAASKAGFRTAYINRPFEFGPDSIPEQKSMDHDYDVNSLEELADKLCMAGNQL